MINDDFAMISNILKNIGIKIECSLTDCICQRSFLMTISHKYKCIFFQIMKSAHSSIKHTLQLYYNGEKMLQFNMKEFRNYYKFAIVRNPWDRMVSNYFFFTNPATPYRKKVKELMFGKDSIEISFDNFIEKTVLYKNHHWEQCYAFLPKDKKGKLLLDYIGYLENLNKDWNKISKEIGFPEFIPIPVTHTTIHENYHKYFTKITKQIVAQMFKDDIDTFTYKF